VRLTAFLLVLAGMPAVWAQTAGPGDGSGADIIASCAETKADEPGLTALEAKCPGITAALEKSGYLPFIPAEEHGKLYSYQIADLHEITTRYSAQPAADEIDPAALAPVLEAMRKEEAARPLTWFERFKRWLRAMLARQQGDSESLLSRWLEQFTVPANVRNAILYTSIVLIVVLAIGVIVNELRVAGIFRRGSAAPGRRVVGADGSLIIDATDADLDSVPPDARVPLLLRMLVSTLVKSGRLRAERALTHSELGLRATFDDTEQRECFRSVALLAERAVYGADEMRPEEFEPVVTAGRALNARLAGERA
jgi:hypothetical protein